MSRRTWITLPLMGVVALGLACGGAAAPTTTQAPAAPAAAATATRAPAAAAATATRVAAAAPTVAASAKATGKVTYAVAGSAGVSGTATDFDPGAWQGGYRGFYHQIYEPLMFMNDEGTNYLSPILAESWEMAKDGLSWTFHLRKGVKFHNGEDFTAAVMVKNIQRAKGLGAPFILGNTAGFETPDTHTMVMKLKGPDLGLLSRLVYGGKTGYPAPAGYIDAVGEAGLRRHPIGTGPYKMVSFNPQAPELVMEVWEGWGGYAGTRPTVKTAREIGIPEETVRIAALATGEVDVIALTPGPHLREFRGGSLRVYSGTQINSVEFLKQSDPTSPYSDVRVRQAMNYAVDKQAIIDALLGGAATVSASMIEATSFGFDPNLKPYPYDPEKARRLLAEAGYAGGLDGGVILATTAQARLLGQAIADYLGKVGMRIRVSPIEAATQSRHWILPNHDLNTLGDLAFQGSSLGGDGDYRIESFFTKWGQYSYIRDNELDSLYESTLKTLDQRERERILQQLARMTNERAYKVFLYHQKFVWGVGPRIAEWTPNVGEGQSVNANTVRLK